MLSAHSARLAAQEEGLALIPAPANRSSSTGFKGVRRQCTPTKVLAVTVLTSLKDGCDEVYRRRPLGQVKKLAEIAVRAGVHGFVCSGEEVGVLKKLYPGKICVVPGTRSPGKKTHDQKRVSTPADAMNAGADYLVGGRQFLEADDPVAEVKRVLSEELPMI